MNQQQKPVVLVTGGSRGIGAATVRKFARAGYQVVLHYHQGRELAEQLQRQVAGEGCAVTLQQADVGDSSQVAAMVAAIEATVGTVDILINNAGIAQQKLFTDITDQEWRNMFAVHVDGTFFCTRAVLPGMIHHKQGSIVNVSSMWGQTGGSCEVHYSAAKGAIQAMTKALAKEVGLSGIRVNCVAPGVIQTDMCRMLDAETLEALREEAPLHQLGTPEQVADLIYFLSTQDASFITGQIIGINGGMVI